MEADKKDLARKNKKIERLQKELNELRDKHEKELVEQRRMHELYANKLVKACERKVRHVSEMFKKAEEMLESKGSTGGSGGEGMPYSNLGSVKEKMLELE